MQELKTGSKVIDREVMPLLTPEAKRNPKILYEKGAFPCCSKKTTSSQRKIGIF